MNVLVTTLTVAAIVGTAGKSQSPWAVPVSAFTKLRADSPLPSTPHSLELSVARGECEGFQVLAVEGSAPFEKPEATVRSAEGKSLPLTWYRTGFVPVKTASNHEGSPGLWADPLVPFDLAATWKQPRQALYAELCVAEPAAAGT